MPVRRYTERRGSGITERDVERVEISAPEHGLWNITDEQIAELRQFGTIPPYSERLRAIRDACAAFLEDRGQSIADAQSKHDDTPEYFAAIIARNIDLIFKNVEHPWSAVMLAVEI